MAGIVVNEFTFRICRILFGIVDFDRHLVFKFTFGLLLVLSLLGAVYYYTSSLTRLPEFAHLRAFPPRQLPPRFVRDKVGRNL